MGSDGFLLFSTDYPHWQFDGEDVLPAGLGQDTIRKMLIDNALDAYPRLREAVGGRSAEREETVS
jgi:predicted TIM-barrel fold metal-dependent hydrolase